MFLHTTTQKTWDILTLGVEFESIPLFERERTTLFNVYFSQLAVVSFQFG
jgi:hypothetical protein